MKNNYKTINWHEKDPNEALDFIYNKTNENEKFGVLKFFIKNFPALEIDWLEVFEDIKFNLQKDEQIEEMLFFVNWYNTRFPEDYKKRYEFVERTMCDYFLFRKDYEQLQQRIEIIKQNPVSGIDTLTIRLFYQLIFHGLYEKAIDYAEVIWKPIDESPDLIGNAAYDFISTLYINELQNYFESMQNKVAFDVDAMFRKAVEMGFANDKKLFDEVIAAINGDVNLAFITDCIKRKKDNHMLLLNIQFLIFMYRQYKMPFIFSELLWNFIATLKIFGKHKGAENWFYIDAKTMDKYIANRYDTLYGTNQLQVFGQVWGLSFIIEFFRHNQLISVEHYDKMLENIAYYKSEMMKINGTELWTMMFVTEWPAADNFLTDPLEKEIFKSTFGIGEREAFEKVDRFITEFPVSERIADELELNKIEKDQLLFNTDNSPIIKTSPDIGRNDSCPCGSGKKYKKCCMK